MTKWAGEQFMYNTIKHFLYSPDLSPSRYHLFLSLKKFLAGQSLRIDQETKGIMQGWLKGLSATFLDEGIQKLVPL